LGIKVGLFEEESDLSDLKVRDKFALAEGEVDKFRD